MGTPMTGISSIWAAGQWAALDWCLLRQRPFFPRAASVRRTLVSGVTDTLNRWLGSSVSFISKAVSPACSWRMPDARPVHIGHGKVREQFLKTKGVGRMSWLRAHFLSLITILCRKPLHLMAFRK